MRGAERGSAVLVLLTVVEVMIFLGTTVVNVAAPSIGRGLGLSEAGLAWVAGIYLLTFGGFLLIGGRAADLLGRRLVFAAGLGVFTAASLLAGLAPWSWLLLAARALQGIGAAIVVPAEISLLAITFVKPKAHARAFGVWSAMGAAGAAAGGVLGGALTQGPGWPSIFLINLPIGVAALTLCGRLLPAGAPEQATARWRRLDLPAAAIGTTALMLVGYAITAAADHGLDTLTTSALAGGLALGALFVLAEARSAAPMMPLRLYRVRNLTGSALANLTVGAAHVPAFLLLALYLQQVNGYRPITSALATLPIAIVNMAVARTVLPPALARYSPRIVLAAGMILLAIGLGGFARLPVHANYPLEVLPASLIFAIGLPAAFAGVTIPAVSAVTPNDTGIAAGIVQTAQRVGSALGATAATAIAAAWTTHHPGPNAYNAGLQVAFAVAASVAVLGALIAVTVIDSRPRPTTPYPTSKPRPTGQ